MAHVVNLRIQAKIDNMSHLVLEPGEMLVLRSFTYGKHTPLPCILPCSLSSMLFFFLLILLLLFLASGYSLVSGRLLLLRTLALASLALVRAC